MRGPSTLLNPLATPAQLSASASQLDGVPVELERSATYAGARMTQIAGVLLRLPQEVIASATVIFTRFWVGPEGGSLREYGIRVSLWTAGYKVTSVDMRQDIATASTYLAAKASTVPKSPRSVLNVYAYIASMPDILGREIDSADLKYEDCYLSEGTYQTQRLRLTQLETIVLRTLGFQTHVALPHALCIYYIQALDVFQNPSAGRRVAHRAFAHLNAGLMNPQLLYLTHQPPALATAAIYLAARQEGVKLPEVEWWEVFDTDREELGFLVVAMLSMDGFAAQEAAAWSGKRIPTTVKELEAALEERAHENGQET